MSGRERETGSVRLTHSLSLFFFRSVCASDQAFLVGSHWHLGYRSCYRVGTPAEAEERAESATTTTKEVVKERVRESERRESAFRRRKESENLIFVLFFLCLSDAAAAAAAVCVLVSASVIIDASFPSPSSTCCSLLQQARDSPRSFSFLRSSCLISLFSLLLSLTRSLASLSEETAVERKEISERSYARSDREKKSG